MTSKKEKYQIEFTIKSSTKILYQYLSNASSLQEWFADKVNLREGDYIFIWDGVEQRAKIAGRKENIFIKYKWVTDDKKDDTFFQFDIVQDELTGDVALVITDFAIPEEIKENKMLWESQVHELMHILGS